MRAKSTIHRDRLAPLYQQYVRDTMSKIKPRTVRDHQDTTRVFIRHLDGRSIDRESCRTWVNYLIDGYAPSSADKMLKQVKRFINWAIAEGVIEESPFKGMRLPPSRRGTPVPFDDQVFERIIANEKESGIGWLFLLGHATGMSVVDCCALRRDEVDVEHGWICRSRQKTGRPCRIPIDPETRFGRTIMQLMELPAVAGWMGRCDRTVYVNDDLARLYRRDGGHTIKNMIRKALDRGGAPKGMTFHNLRNRYCSILANSGASLLVVKEATGQSVETFQQYVTVDQEVLREQTLGAFRRHGEKQG